MKKIYSFLLIVLSNLDALNASMIDNNISQKQRLERLNQTARKELEVLTNDKNVIFIQSIDEKKNKLIETK